MELGIREDFTVKDITLDSQLTALPSTGLYLNSGVHPSITLDNLLSFLPKFDLTLSAWDNGTTYGVFTESKSKSDIVTYNSVIYQSIKAGIGNQPDEEPTYWIETNKESLRLKAFIESVKDRVYSDLNLNRRLVNNEYLYEVSTQSHTLPNDYAGWVLEPKGSDYVYFVINEIALQKAGTTPVDVYIVNQGELVTTLSVTPNDGKLTFTDVGYTLSGKGKHIIAIDSTVVLSDQGYIDPLKYDGFTVGTVVGIGDTPEDATYTLSNYGNGLGFNFSAYFDGARYMDNNYQLFGSFIRSVFEFMVFQMFLHNPNAVANYQQRIGMSNEILLGELKNTDMDSVISRYYRELKKAQKIIEKTNDTGFETNDTFTIKLGSI